MGNYRKYLPEKISIDDLRVLFEWGKLYCSNLLFVNFSIHYRLPLFPNSSVPKYP